ncbi:histone deacetylase family protein [Uliginosibacterium aquaticum]|uniref:Histone deacetylase family protein n=1 Tax=Uliginosibacterium aquaticum TaxID=2731212 RepID=A0ABX2ICK3_9RHOO|nr:histone deacetylase family protein [Uliginosibacterium aquaticum]NSL54141.1 histone deacetylase family protein [Uliginosibacterium aquaticum]
MSRTAFITHPDCWLHTMGAQHPESPERLTEILDRIRGEGLDGFLDMREDAPTATLEQLYRAHSPAYVEELFEIAPESGLRHLDPDTAMTRHTLKAALRAAGAGILASELVLAGRVHNAFCAVRPPGHHAERLRAMGFCFFNNVAVAARHVLEVHGLERVSIIDFDVHHGNGTENIFIADPRVQMLSFFQHPLYPYCGTQVQVPHMLNSPFPAGTRGDAVRELLTHVWLPALTRHQPQMLFISAGFDAHYEDDMASMGLLDKDFDWISRELRQWADAHCGGRLVSMLEGGYVLPALGRSVIAHVRALADI